MKGPVQPGTGVGSDTPQAALHSGPGADALIDLLPAMAWTATPEGLVDYVNQACCIFTGLEREQLLGTGMAQCVHPDDRPRTETMKVQLSDARPLDTEFRIKRHDGEYIRCVVRAVPLRDRAGQIVKWVGATIDVEELSLESDELKVREEHLQLALDSADIGIWRLKLPTYELMVDERTRRHLDLDKHVIHDYRPQDLIHPDDWPNSSSQVPDTRGRCVTEHRIRQRDGSYRWQAIHWRLWPQGEGEDAPSLITGTSMDITARKEAEAEREELGQRYRMALSAAGLGTWSTDFDKRVMHMDERAQLHLGLDEPTVNFERLIALIHEDDRENTIESLKGKLMRGTAEKHRYAIAFRVRHPNGQIRWIASHVHTTFSADGSRPVRQIGVSRDITESKEAEEKVRRANADLELRVQQRTAELTAANRELESFAYAVSHDLRGPLRAMWGFSDALLQDYGESLPPRAREYLQHVIDGSRQLGEIIEGLLTLSRSTSGELRRDVIDLSVIAEKVLRELALVDPERRVTWAIEPQLRGRGDSRMINAVMRNLLDNAWKYTAHRSDAHIRVYGEHTDGEYAYCVEDNGAGFDMAHAEKLFQPFQRLHRQDEFSGLGIGLATVQRIIDRHGGKVTGTGIEGQGAKFRFTLPLSDDLSVRANERHSGAA